MASFAFGGSFESQVGTFVLFLSFIIAGVNGYRSILNKDIMSHRDWMIRLFAYGSSVLTLRLFMFIGMLISPSLGLQTTARCNVINSLIGSNQTMHLFPDCGSPTVDDEKTIIIKGSFATVANVMAGLRIGYQTSLLLSLLVHVCVAEWWIRERYYIRIQSSVPNEVKARTVSREDDIVD